MDRRASGNMMLHRMQHQAKRPRLEESIVLRKSPLLKKSLMTMDGHLLSAVDKDGTCIPDKLVDKKELMEEIIDEVLRQLKTSRSKADEVRALQFLTQYRRSSVSSAKSRIPTTKTAAEKKLQRKSWGPDNTWASQFNMTTFTEIDHADETHRKKITLAGDNKKLRREVESAPQRKTNIYSRHSSVLNDVEVEKALMQRQERETDERRRELMKVMSWIISEGHDYVHTEQAKTPTDVEIFLDVMLSSTIPVQMSFKVNSPTDISITYQFLPNFKDEYMILKISRTHCMVMRAF